MWTCFSVQVESPSVSFLGSPLELELAERYLSEDWPSSPSCLLGTGWGEELSFRGYSNWRWNRSINDLIKSRRARREKRERKKWKSRKNTLSFRFWILRNHAIVEYQGVFAASFPSMFLNIHLQGGGGLQAQEVRQDLTALHASLSTSFLSQPGRHLSHDAPTVCQGACWALPPLPKKCRRGSGSCSGGAQPPSPLHIRPCSTTSLRGLQQQPSPDSRGVRDLNAQEQREQLASGQLVVCKCHHMDIYRNAASRKKEAAPRHFLSGFSKEKPSAHLQSLPPRAGRLALGQAKPSAGCTQQAATQGRTQTSTPELNYSDRLHYGIKHWWDYFASALFG